MTFYETGKNSWSVSFFFPKADSFAFNNRKVPNTKLIFLKKYSLKQQI